MLAIDIPYSLSQVVQFIGAGLAAFLFFILGEKMAGRLQTSEAKNRMDRYSGEDQRSQQARHEQEIVFGSEKHRLRMAFARYHIQVNGHEKLALWVARFSAGLAIAFVLQLVGLTPLFSIIGFLGGLLLVNGLQETSWIGVKAELEKEIPQFLNGFISTIQVTRDIPRAVDEEIEALDPKGPLAGWLKHFVQACQSRGMEALPDLEAEAFQLSVSLGSVLFLIRRLQETGGEEYRQAFTVAAANQGGILDARAQARASGSGARGAVLIIVAMVVFVIVVMVKSPTIADTVAQPLVQLVYAGLSLLMCFGWGLINKMIDDLI
jgi:Flp pilus assembly protein TadB